MQQEEKLGTFVSRFYDVKPKAANKIISMLWIRRGLRRVVSIAIRYELGVRGSNPAWGKFFSVPLRTCPAAHTAVYNDTENLHRG